MTEATKAHKKLTKKAQAEAERDEAIAELRKYMKPGATVYTKMKHCARSGMMRVIDVFVIRNNEPLRLTWSACIAVGIKYNRKHEGAEMGGCGMDMGFALVYEIGATLYRKPWRCVGEKCPCNEHSNPPHPKRDGKMMHAAVSGGYALKQRWM